MYAETTINRKMFPAKLNPDKVLAAIAFVFLFAASLVIVSTPSATGYEISIYEAYPMYLWGLFVGSFACGITIIVRQIFSEQQSRWWMTGLLIVFITNSVFLLLPEFRGYIFYGYGDTLTHLGRIKIVTTTGHLGEYNFYPLIHILGASMNLVVNISLPNILSLFFVLFYCVYVINMYLLARLIGDLKGQALMVLVLALPLTLNLTYVRIPPQVVAMIMVPCLLYFWYRKVQMPATAFYSTLLLILLILFITFFHPMTTLLTLIILLIVPATWFIYSRLISSKPYQSAHLHFPLKNALNVSMIMGIVFFAWYFGYARIEKIFKGFVDWILYGLGESTYTQQVSQLGEAAEAGLSLPQTIEVFFLRYGAVALLLGISTIAFFLVCYFSLSRRPYFGFAEFATAGQFLIAGAIGIVALSSATFGRVDPIRAAQFPLIFGIVISGLVFYKILRRPFFFRRIRWIIGMTVIIVLIMAAWGLGAVYDSPWVYKANTQVTQARLAGSKWLFTARTDTILVGGGHPNNLRKLYHYHFMVAPDEMWDLGLRIFDSESVPSHFGYDTGVNIKEALHYKAKYLAVFERDRISEQAFPENVRGQASQWNDQDFAKLESDPAAMRLYSNGGFEAWKIYGRDG